MSAINGAMDRGHPAPLFEFQHHMTHVFISWPANDISVNNINCAYYFTNDSLDYGTTYCKHLRAVQ
jgi:hypothetical protein